jgi:tetratricopeptide (TPR) repeat protein
LKSPDHNYEVRENGDRRTYIWTIKNFVPDRKRDREDDEQDDDEQLDVQLSTFTDWQQVAHWYANLQSERVVVDDAVRKKAAELTQGATTAAEKSRRLYDYVARNIRYVSLSFGVGRLQPHAASEVMQNGFGDCKDKHTLLEALLRAADIQSYPVLINSSHKLDPEVPSPAQFDHEITAVKLGDRLTWLDSTAEVAPYGLLLYQLRNKQALLASTDANAGLRLTPADSPVRNLEVMKLDGKFSETGALDLTVDLTAQGDSDVPLRAAFRRLPEAQWQRLLEIFSAGWGLEGEVSEVRLDSLEDTSKPFHLTYRCHKGDYFRVPTSGTDFRLLPPIALSRTGPVNLKKAAEPLDVGPAVERIYSAHIQLPPNFTLRTPSSVTMTRDYGEYSSSYNVNGNVLEAGRRLLLKVNELPASRRTDYESFRNVTANELQQVLSASITAVAGAGNVAATKLEGTPQELQKAATAALQRRDFTTAADLLKRVVEKDAQRKNAWDQLGQAYAGLNQHDEAIAAFRKQIELDAYHESANRELAVELQRRGELEEAVAAYRKQLAITPYEKAPHKGLGLLLVQMKRDADARSELEAAAAIPPEDPEVRMALAQVYSRTGDAEKAAALLRGVMGVAVTAPGADMFASALRDDLDPRQTEREARQTLDQIGEQFDSGEYEKLVPSAFSAMNLVALAWARIGWAKFLQNELLESMQYLNSAWMLSQSGAVGNRLGRVFEKEGQRDKARHMFALAAAAGGPEGKASRERLLKLSVMPDAADKEIAQVGVELLQMRTIQLPPLATSNASAQFGLLFDNSNMPERAEFLDGDAALRGAGDKLQEKVYPVKFPDVSSVKIVRRGTLTCTSSGCSMVLEPVQGLQP